ncbi:hypothetical protein BGZ96_012789 [Linnemannia gamsii]|uniref:Uncharacterized protein n=1 Tax=Linnemannia gamsii TaxID=64522 RepID=A0ABQ7JQL2_9FUNG|nr:hypothetical protein BGZ96_012789 [Linnemannia gamsii]
MGTPRKSFSAWMFKEVCEEYGLSDASTLRTLCICSEHCAFAQNIVQLDSVLTAKKRKRKMRDVDREEEPLSKQKAYGIVTDSNKWVFVECTMHEGETVSFRMSWLSEALNIGGNCEDDAKKISAKIARLWSRIRNEIPALENRSRKLSAPTINKGCYLKKIPE